MEKSTLLAATILAASTISAAAADLPSRKAAAYVDLPPPPMWTGFYIGLNAGYGFGGSSGVTTTGFGANQSAAAWNGLNGVGVGPFTLETAAGMGGLGAANSGFANASRSGFIGGGQIGYNYQVGNFVLGLEADMQGTGIRGAGSWSGFGSDAYSIGLNDRGGVVIPSTNLFNQSHIGGGSIQSGIDWMGTVRGRVGYLATPNLLLYGTGGLAYGGAWAKATTTSLTTTTIGDIAGLGPFAGAGLFNQVAAGSGRASETMVGWSAGGGGEWKMDRNWSLKAEGLYYDLGSLNVSGFSGAPPAINLVGLATPIAPGLAPALAAIPGAGSLNASTSSRVRMDGVIVRVGVNRSFDWF